MNVTDAVCAAASLLRAQVDWKIFLKDVGDLSKRFVLED